jgi:uncharacterized membrane protein HdeD (DUF308 family)
MMWFKPFILLLLALLILFYPAVVISTLGLILAMYFLIDGFAGLHPLAYGLFVVINHNRDTS